MKRLAVPLAVTLMFSFTLAQTFTWPNAWSANTPEEAVTGGTLRSYSLSDPRTFNPFVSAEQNDVVDAANLTTLITQGPDSDAFLPYMAESFTVSDDGLVVTLNVREGMRWSDGEDITAADFFFTYTAETDEAVGSNGYDSWFINGQPIVGELVDEYTLRFTFPEPDRTALPVMAISPAPDHILGEIYREGGAEALKAAWGTDSDVSETVWATPFVPVSFTPGQRIVFERNPYFAEWNEDEAGNGLPYLDRYTVTIVESVDAALNLYLAGELDSFAPPTVDALGVINQAIVNGELDATLLPNQSPVASSQFITFNWNKASDPFKESLFRDARFRQAMSHLVDREAIIDLVYGGSAAPMWSNVYQVYDYWVDPDVPKFPYNPERAVELLEELGFTELYDNGVRANADGDAISFTLATNAGNTQREEIAIIFADAARAVGVEVDVQAVDFNLLVDQLLSTGDDRPFDAILIGLQGGNRVYPFGPNVIPCDTNLHMYNQSGACLDDLEQTAEDLYFEGRATLDTEAARDIGYDIQRALAELQAQIYTVSPLAHYSWLSSVRGEHPEGMINAAVGARQLPLTYKVD